MASPQHRLFSGVGAAVVDPSFSVDNYGREAIADSQPQCNLQVFNNLVDFGMNVQEAVEAPRFCGYSFPRSPWPHREYPNLLEIEGRVPQDLVDTLSDQGERLLLLAGPG